ncbi:MAG TPA: DUF1080 domain-containing protein [Verrucomicrobiae bacterium]
MNRSLVILSLFTATIAATAADNPFVGDWALTIPGGAAGWLGVDQDGDQLKASMLWGWGSVFSLDSAKMESDSLVLTRRQTVERKNAEGQKVKTTITEVITCNAAGDTIKLTSVKPRENGQGEEKSEFAGKRQPPMPPAPDLAQVKYGQPIRLFNGTDLSGWKLTDPNAVNGWSVRNGLLVNNPAQEEGKPHKNYGNLRTDAEFGDFNLRLEVRVSKGQNSGIYLRGIYEVQVADTYGRGLDPHNMGGVYSRITPTVSAERAPGEWQTMDVTLVARHVTVALNGQRIIDNQPVRGCTGGALWSDVMRPGPIYFQGDHTGIEYRNIMLRPVVQ